jgi:hypothetical protein
MSDDAKAYYGYLFETNKQPTKVLDQLLRGIANHIVSRICQPLRKRYSLSQSESVGSKEEKCLVPEKLATFYKAVGGNYDCACPMSHSIPSTWIASRLICPWYCSAFCRSSSSIHQLDLCKHRLSAHPSAYRERLRTPFYPSPHDIGICSLAEHRDSVRT